jgi:hypothetical protein
MSSPSELITSTKLFDVDAVTYAPPKTDARGGKRIAFKLNDNPIVLSIPLMFTWGVNERVDENSGRVSYDLAVVFETDKSNAVKVFRDKLAALENRILDDASNAKSMEWFGKAKQSREVCESLMYPILKYPKDKNTGEPDKSRDPNMKLKLSYWDDKFSVELYDMEGNPTFLPKSMNDKSPLQLIPSKSHIKGLISCDGIWCAGGRFGVTWKLIQARVRVPVNLTGTGVCHIMDDDDDDEILGNIENEEKVSGVSTVESDDDDEEDKTTAAVEVVEEIKPKKKKVVRRKKAASAEATE